MKVKVQLIKEIILDVDNIDEDTILNGAEWQLEDPTDGVPPELNYFTSIKWNIERLI